MDDTKNNSLKYMEIIYMKQQIQELYSIIKNKQNLTLKARSPLKYHNGKLRLAVEAPFSVGKSSGKLELNTEGPFSVENKKLTLIFDPNDFELEEREISDDEEEPEQEPPKRKKQQTGSDAKRQSVSDSEEEDEEETENEKPPKRKKKKTQKCLILKKDELVTVNDIAAPLIYTAGELSVDVSEPLKIENNSLSIDLSEYAKIDDISGKLLIETADPLAFDSENGKLSINLSDYAKREEIAGKLLTEAEKPLSFDSDNGKLSIDLSDYATLKFVENKLLLEAEDPLHWDHCHGKLSLDLTTVKTELAETVTNSVSETLKTQIAEEVTENVKSSIGTTLTNEITEKVSENIGETIAQEVSEALKDVEKYEFEEPIINDGGTIALNIAENSALAITADGFLDLNIAENSPLTVTAEALTIDGEKLVELIEEKGVKTNINAEEPLSFDGDSLNLAYASPLKVENGKLSLDLDQLTDTTYTVEEPLELEGNKIILNYDNTSMELNQNGELSAKGYTVAEPLAISEEKKISIDLTEYPTREEIAGKLLTEAAEPLAFDSDNGKLSIDLSEYTTAEKLTETASGINSQISTLSEAVTTLSGSVDEVKTQISNIKTDIKAEAPLSVSGEVISLIIGDESPLKVENSALNLSYASPLKVENGKLSLDLDQLTDTTYTVEEPLELEGNKIILNYDNTSMELNQNGELSAKSTTYTAAEPLSISGTAISLDTSGFLMSGDSIQFNENLLYEKENYSSGASSVNYHTFKFGDRFTVTASEDGDISINQNYSGNDNWSTIINGSPIIMGTSMAVDTLVDTSGNSYITAASLSDYAKASDVTTLAATVSETAAEVAEISNEINDLAETVGDLPELMSEETNTWSKKFNYIDSIAENYCFVEYTPLNGEPLWVALGKSSSNLSAYSKDGINWTAGSGVAMFSSYLIRVASNGEKILAASHESRRLIKSTDGATWEELSTPFSSVGVYGLAWGEINGTGIFVAYGDSQFCYSYDGETWTKTGTAAGYTVYNIIYGGEMFIAYGTESPYASYSLDGINWYSATGAGNVGTAPAISWGKMNGKGVFAALGSAGGYYSFDGINWTNENYTITEYESDGEDYAKMCYIPLNNKTGIFMAVFNLAYTCFVSYDGYTWDCSIYGEAFGYGSYHNCSAIASGIITKDGIKYRGAIVVAENDRNNYTILDNPYTGEYEAATVADLLTELQETAQQLQNAATSEEIAEQLAEKVTISTITEKTQIYTVDPRTFTAATTPASGSWTCLWSDGSTIVAGGTSSPYFAYSTDYGNTWTDSPATVSGHWQSICYVSDKSRFIAVGDATPYVAASDDGINWYTTVYSGISGGVFSVMYINSTLFCCGINNVAYFVSGSSSVWTSVSLSDTYRKILYSENLGIFVIVGENGYTAYSSDGKSWTESATLSGKISFRDCFWDGSKFIVIGQGSAEILYTSEDGKTWTAISSSLDGKTVFNKIIFANNAFVAIGSDDSVPVIAYSKNDLTAWTVIDSPGFSYTTTNEGALNDIIYENSRLICCSANSPYFVRSNDEKTLLTYTEETTAQKYATTEEINTDLREIRDTVESVKAEISEFSANYITETKLNERLGETEEYTYEYTGEWTAGNLSSGMAVVEYTPLNGEPLWVALGKSSSNLSAYSKDGINWTAGSGVVMFSSSAIHIASNGEKIIACSKESRRLIKSTDGATWEEISTPFDNVGLYGLAWGEINGVGMFVTYADSQFCYSYDGETWTKTGQSVTTTTSSTLTDKPEHSFNNMIYGDIDGTGIFIYAHPSTETNGGYNIAYLYYSYDGKTWNEISTKPHVLYSGYFSLGFGKINNKGVFVYASGYDGGGVLIYSYDGVNWSDQIGYSLNYPWFSGIKYLPLTNKTGIFITTSAWSNNSTRYPVILTSTNGISWNETELNEFSLDTSPTLAAGKITINGETVPGVAVVGGDYSPYVIYSATNLISKTYTPVTDIIDDTAETLKTNIAERVKISNFEQITDIETAFSKLTTIDIPEQAQCNKIAYGKGTDGYVYVLNDMSANSIMYSYNGINWNAADLTNCPNALIYEICFGEINGTPFFFGICVHNSTATDWAVYSNDGKTWNSCTDNTGLSSSLETDYARLIFAENKGFYALLHDAGIIYSLDGKTLNYCDTFYSTNSMNNLINVGDYILILNLYNSVGYLLTDSDGSPSMIVAAQTNNYFTDGQVKAVAYSPTLDKLVTINNYVSYFGYVSDVSTFSEDNLLTITAATVSSSLQKSDWYSVAWFESFGAFVACSQSSPYFAYSTNGTSWAAVDTTVSGNFHNITEQNGRLFISDDAKILFTIINDQNQLYPTTIEIFNDIFNLSYSAGASINSISSTVTATTTALNSVQNNMITTMTYLAATPQTTTEETAEGLGIYVNKIAAGEIDGVTVLVGTSTESPYAIYSTDNGKTWTAGTMASGDTKWGKTFYGSTFAEVDGVPMFVAILSPTSDYGRAYSLDGINWTINMENNGPETIRSTSCAVGIINGSTIFATYGTEAHAYNGAEYSTDGINWTNVNSAGDLGSFCSICFGADMFVAYGSESPFSAYSTTGKTWTAGNGIAITSARSSIAYGETVEGLGLFVVYGDSSPYSAYSTDGKTWTAGSGIYLGELPSLVYVDKDETTKIFVAYGSESPYLVYSSDGINWTALDVSENVGAGSLCWFNGSLLCYGEKSPFSIFYDLESVKIDTAKDIINLCNTNTQTTAESLTTTLNSIGDTLDTLGQHYLTIVENTEIILTEPFKYLASCFEAPAACTGIAYGEGSDGIKNFVTAHAGVNSTYYCYSSEDLTTWSAAYNSYNTDYCGEGKMLFGNINSTPYFVAYLSSSTSGVPIYYKSTGSGKWYVKWQNYIVSEGIDTSIKPTPVFVQNRGFYRPLITKSGFRCSFFNGSNHYLSAVLSESLTGIADVNGDILGISDGQYVNSFELNSYGSVTGVSSSYSSYFDSVAISAAYSDSLGVIVFTHNGAPYFTYADAYEGAEVSEAETVIETVFNYVEWLGDLGMFVACSDSSPYLAYSLDGKNWKEIEDIPEEAFYQVTFVNGVLLACTASGVLMCDNITAQTGYYTTNEEIYNEIQELKNSTTSQTITHDTKPEEDLNQYETGKPCFMSGNVYSWDKTKLKWIEETTATDCIPGAKTDGEWSEFLGIITKIDPVKNLVQFATHGDYLFKCEDSSAYSVGDVLTYEGEKIDPETPITTKIKISTIGRVTKIIDGETVAIFRD